MIDYLCPDLTNEQTVEANETQELLFTLGADMSVPRTTVADLLSPQTFCTTSVHFAPGDVLHWRLHGRGEMWGFAQYG